MIRSRISGEKLVELISLIKENGQKIGKEFKYNPGWSDARISKELKISENIVYYRRLNSFGLLYKEKTPNLFATEELEIRVKELEAQVQEHKEMLDLILTSITSPSSAENKITGIADYRDMKKAIGKNKLKYSYLQANK